MTSTPFDPAISATRFVVAATSGLTWQASVHADATRRLATLEADRNLWISSHADLERSWVDG